MAHRDTLDVRRARVLLALIGYALALVVGISVATVAMLRGWPAPSLYSLAGALTLGGVLAAGHLARLLTAPR